MTITTDRKTGPRPRPPATTLKQLGERVDELYRAIRGYNGEPGMAANLMWLMEAYKKTVEKDIPAMKQDIIDAMCAKIDAKDQPNVKWPELLKGLFFPLLVALLSGGLGAIITHFIIDAARH